MSFKARLQEIWSSVQGKMLTIVGFLGIVSTLLVAGFSAAILNVVIRRESAYLRLELC